ncbi:MAG TPA: hypothetical protein PLQ50_01300 [Candidatus Woesebacteria bacterium]|nr:hypothetical protein [Candidatus Woesebacteria bacterium]
MSKFFILFGNTVALSKLEFEAIYPQFPLTDLGDHLFTFTSAVDLSKEMISTLGGVVKIFKVVAEFEQNITDQKLIEEIVAFLLKQSDEPYFTFSQIGKGQRSISNAELKALIKENGKKARYFASQLSESALLSHQDKAIELLSYHHQETGKLLLAQITAVQDIDDWTKRDRQKPYADRKKGMLPPKVARMMVNIALGFWRKNNLNKATNADQALLYDPFCGTGTILLEAAMRGLNVYGSDLDQKAVFGSRDNLSWLKQEYKLNVKDQIFYMDASHLDLSQFTNQVDLLVSEPFLGRQTPDDSELANIFKGLEKMYLGSFKSFASILSDKAMVVIVLPQVSTAKRIYSLLGLIDKLKAKGYNLLVDPVPYAREGARVTRQICLFRFNRQT